MDRFAEEGQSGGEERQRGFFICGWGKAGEVDVEVRSVEGGVGGGVVGVPGGEVAVELRFDGFGGGGGGARHGGCW